MGEYKDFCPPPKPDCCPPPVAPKPEFCKPMCGRTCCYESKCDNGSIGGLGIVIILIVVYCLFCGNDEKGGLFGGLF